MKFNEECQAIYYTEIHIHFLIQFKVWLMTMDILALTISLSSSGKYLIRLEQPWKHIEGSGAQRNNTCLTRSPLMLPLLLQNLWKRGRARGLALALHSFFCEQECPDHILVVKITTQVYLSGFAEI